MLGPNPPPGFARCAHTPNELERWRSRLEAAGYRVEAEAPARPSGAVAAVPTIDELLGGDESG